MKLSKEEWSRQLLQIFAVSFLVIRTTEAMSDPCNPSPCGTNTQCISRESRPVCVCLPGYWGNPLSYCQRGECAETRDCPGSRVCRDYRCVDICEGQCGARASCTPRNHIPVCTCPPGYTGDALTSCRPFDPQELCNPSPCGRNTRCEVVNGVPTCSCLPGFVGAPLTGCNHECESDYDCPGSTKCSNFKCTQLCTPGSCAANARCDVNNHRSVCTCPPGTFGDPYISCNLECESHYDCPSGRPACSAGKCIDPCAQGVCGVGADCRVKERTTPVCSCPRDMTGDPFVSCRPFDKTDLCVPNPCGTNAQCTPGHDRTGKERPVCTCPPGYSGNALVHCRRGECSSDSECRYDQVCDGYQCLPACQNQCGTGAQCIARNHAAVCSCPPGTTGQPLARCNPVQPPVAAVRRGGRLFYEK
ncbi:neurogenic locus notch homolog protein 4 [Halyomorpha halys]|uniref:neurogenic locus notch homolog protein 4 n=1 Tax=Halyomorpha halys TaxID=286706 RepID=UPI0006D4DF5E|nr:neurogenic locus notch homolog protein 2 [Halyomorpha halys]